MAMNTEKTVAIYGSDVHYWIFNDDKPITIVMIHGLRGTHHGLQKIIDKLPEYRIIVPDLPGFGASTPMQDQQHDIAGYVAFVHQFLQKVAPKTPILLGHSFGSIITSYYAAAQPQTIQKLILVNAIATPALKGPRTIFTQFARLYYWLGNTLPEKPGRALLSSKAIVMATSISLAKTKDKQLRRDIHKSHLTYFSTFQTRDVLAQAFRASVTATAADCAEQIVVPTLLIAGAIDDIAPAKGQYALETRIPDARLTVVQNVGHLIHHEAPAQAADAIRDFLA